MLKQSTPRQGTEIYFDRMSAVPKSETINAPSGDGNSSMLGGVPTVPGNNQRPVRGRKSPIYGGRCPHAGNNQRPVRGRKCLRPRNFLYSVVKQSTPRQGTEMVMQNIPVPPTAETINAPSGDGNDCYPVGIVGIEKKQSTPRQGTEMGVDVCLISHGIETINAPSGDGNMRGISFRHCTMKKLLPRQGTETSSHCRIFITRNNQRPARGREIIVILSCYSNSILKQSIPRQGTERTSLRSLSECS